MANTPILHLPYPTEDDTVDPPRDIGALASALDPLGVVPVGSMLMWPTAAAPVGWLLANGQQVDAGIYPGLAALFGQVGGNVTLPDYRDTFPVGAGPTIPLGLRGGAASVALTTAQLPSHNHGGLSGFRDRSQNHSHTIGSGFVSLPGRAGQAGSQYVIGDSVGSATDANDAPDHKHTISADGGGGTHENRPPFLAINFIIRAG
jgi:microcystin-dependent protein